MVYFKILGMLYLNISAIILVIGLLALIFMEMPITINPVAIALFIPGWFTVISFGVVKAWELPAGE
jgi:hypothetical protein